MPEFCRLILDKLDKLAVANNFLGTTLYFLCLVYIKNFLASGCYFLSFREALATCVQSVNMVDNF